jgi:hypothetical protein
MVAVAGEPGTRNTQSMCVTIQLVVPPAYTAVASGALSTRMPFWGERIGTAPNGDVILAVMAAGGACQCTTGLGSVQPPARANRAADARKIDAMRRQGRSAGKIERWLAEKRRTETKYERALHAPADGQTQADVDGWLAFIEDVVGTRSLDRIGIHVGFDYEGAVEREPIVVPLKGLSKPLLRGMTYDSVYTFVLN